MHGKQAMQRIRFQTPLRKRCFNTSETKKSIIGRFPFRRNMRKLLNEFRINMMSEMAEAILPNITVTP